ncbi:helix-turn-helix transcriptional regulator [Alicyclobacillus mengziensis]|uniref:Helix-turn-helix transcriptional regulator n=1 Tax=Alicyclobacillus mengziensis TaxID=2931921 RepID=A0A9X7VX37_9BACL|nr:AraC family transcriptional regulator [Alicyclobacillus mengziensis]QSO46447.1 helix-turn-helix transcriptional regulator [Alicyclobacillus mengziensis]
MQGDCTHGAIVLAAGYSVHDAQFYASNREGLASYLIRLQTEGNAQMLIDQDIVEIGAGDVVLYAPGDPYVLSIAEPGAGSAVSSDFFVFCRGRWLDKWWSSKVRPKRANILLSDETVGLWRQLVWHHKGVSKNKAEKEDYILRALCLHLDDAMLGWEDSPTTAESLVAYQMKAFLLQHAGNDISVQGVADHVGLSVSRAVHLFKETFNQTMVQFLQETRLSMACDRIRFSRMTLEEAAESSGFRSYSYFYRLFRSRFGMSPTQFRANMK